MRARALAEPCSILAASQVLAWLAATRVDNSPIISASWTPKPKCPVGTLDLFFPWIRWVLSILGNYFEKYNRIPIDTWTPSGKIDDRDTTCISLLSAVVGRANT